MKAWIIAGLGLLLGCAEDLRAQTNAAPGTSTATTEPKKMIYAIEKLVVEPQEIGLDAERTIEGMVINVESPVKILANDNPMPVTSSEFREKNLKFGSYGMHSWMSITYKITEENDKRVTLYLMEFKTAKDARKFWIGGDSSSKDLEEDKQLELKGSLFYQLLHGPILLKVTWPEPKTPGVEKIIATYKSKLLLM